MKSLLPLLLISLLATVSVLAEDPPAAAPAAAQPKSLEEVYASKGVNLVKGPTTVPLGKSAQMVLPEGYYFVGEKDLDRYFEITHNGRGGKEVGVLLSPGNWNMFFDYDPVGYVKDDEKDKLDAGKLMTSMTEGQEQANEARKERGWDEMKVRGWATSPYYDQKTNNLKWAINLSTSQDNHQEIFINESIRLLGRGGVMNVTLVSDTATFKAAEAEAEQLLARNFSYVAGEKYAEYKPGDKIAQYGLAALVLGGGAAAAAKMGFLAKFGALLGKLGKGIVLVFVAIGVAIKKIFDKITGARPSDDSSA